MTARMEAQSVWAALNAEVQGLIDDEPTRKQETTTEEKVRGARLESRRGGSERGREGSTHDCGMRGSGWGKRGGGDYNNNTTQHVSGRSDGLCDRNKRQRGDRARTRGSSAQQGGGDYNDSDSTTQHINGSGHGNNKCVRKGDYSFFSLGAALNNMTRCNDGSGHDRGLGAGLCDRHERRRSNDGSGRVSEQRKELDDQRRCRQGSRGGDVRVSGQRTHSNYKEFDNTTHNNNNTQWCNEKKTSSSTSSIYSASLTFSCVENESDEYSFTADAFYGHGDSSVGADASRTDVAADVADDDQQDRSSGAGTTTTVTMVNVSLTASAEM